MGSQDSIKEQKSTEKSIIKVDTPDKLESKKTQKDDIMMAKKKFGLIQNEPEESNIKMKSVEVDFEKSNEKVQEVKSFGEVEKQMIEIHLPDIVGTVKIVCNGKVQIIQL